jgi:hypothetical protein
MKLSVFFLVFLSLSGCLDKSLKSKLRPQIADTLTWLEKSNEVPGWAVGYQGKPSLHLKTTQWFEKAISVDEGLILMTHENAFIRSIAFKKLCTVHHSNVFDYLIKSYSDSTIIYKSGCVGCEFSEFDYYIESAGYPYRKEFWNRHFTEKQKITIDSLIATREYFKTLPPADN